MGRELKEQHESQVDLQDRKKNFFIASLRFLVPSLQASDPKHESKSAPERLKRKKKWFWRGLWSRQEPAIKFSG